MLSKKYLSIFLSVVAVVASVAALPRFQGGPVLPELPRLIVDTSSPTQSGRLIAVRAGESVQAAYDAAQPGDTIELEAGAVFRENLKYRGTGRPSR